MARGTRPLHLSRVVGGPRDDTRPRAHGRGVGRRRRGPARRAMARWLARCCDLGTGARVELQALATIRVLWRNPGDPLRWPSCAGVRLRTPHGARCVLYGCPHRAVFRQTALPGAGLLSRFAEQPRRGDLLPSPALTCEPSARARRAIAPCDAAL